MNRGWMLLEDESFTSLTINIESCGCCLTNKQCSCGCEVYYNPKFDAIFCPYCNTWLERNCGDKNCMFCSIRPDKPLKN